MILSDPDYPPAIGGPPPFGDEVDDPGGGIPVATDDVPAGGPPGPRHAPSAVVRLFAHHEHVDVGDVGGGLGRRTVDDLVHDGLLAREGGSVVARFGIERWGPVLVLHDWPERSQDPEYVMGVTNSARSLAYVTPRQPVERFLDLGTGSGVQALLASRHCEHVVATDVAERAVALARASVRLNDVDNVDVRTGSWFEPVVGETFDLVVSNPPFVISPEDRFVYRDSSGPVDELCGSILADVPAHLVDGGVAVLMAQWARRSGDEWWSTPAGWLAGLDVDGLAIRYGAMSPRQYAVLWNQFSVRAADERHAAVERWLEHFRLFGVEDVYEGVVAVRRPAAGTDRTPCRSVVVADRVLDGPGGISCGGPWSARQPPTVPPRPNSWRPWPGPWTDRHCFRRSGSTPTGTRWTGSGAASTTGWASTRGSSPTSSRWCCR